METGLRPGYLGTVRQKGRIQTNQTYCYRATPLLYRPPVPVVAFSPRFFGRLSLADMTIIETPNKVPESQSAPD